MSAAYSSLSRARSSGGLVATLTANLPPRNTLIYKHFSGWWQGGKQIRKLFLRARARVYVWKHTCHLPPTPIKSMIYISFSGWQLPF
jgi:hypothetical protein